MLRSTFAMLGAFLVAGRSPELLAQRLTLGGEVFVFRIVSERYPSGQVKHGTLSLKKTVSLGGIKVTFDSYSSVSFYESGKVKSGTLASNQNISVGGVRYVFKGGFYDSEEELFGEMSFYPSGKVKSGSLARPKTLLVGGKKITFPGYDRHKRATEGDAYYGLVFFYESGDLSGGGVLPSRVSVGREKPLVDVVMWAEEGKKLIQCRLAKAASIAGKAHKKGTVIRLYTDGMVAGTGEAWDDDWVGNKPKPK